MEGKEYSAKKVLVAVPLAILQKGLLKFKPCLPTDKLKAINGLGAGIIEKVGHVGRILEEGDILQAGVVQLSRARKGVRMGPILRSFCCSLICNVEQVMRSHV